mmetsp:Transcript_25789/g.32909  ORF Transcript_25789/g.32909 Transcript_25789/m.32909 type:complete len:280 (-) Transcript_25789:45-884(-)
MSASKLSGNTDEEKLAELCSKCHKDQGIWFLNVFWSGKGEQEAERVWAYVHKFNELDMENHEEGSSIDEMGAHRFLESFGDAMTVVAMRNLLRKVGAIGEGRPKNFPLTHFLIAHFDADWRVMVNATMGENAEEVAKAQKMLKEAQESMKVAQDAANEAKAAAEEVRKEQKKYDDKTTSLTEKTTQGGVVSKNRAKAELAQHLAEDPLPLRRAKITAESAEKRAEKTLKQAMDRVTELEAYLKELQNNCGSAGGSLWWIDRELHEARKFMPKARGGIDK